MKTFLARIKALVRDIHRRTGPEFVRLEDEIRALGFIIERCRLNGRALPQEIRDRLYRARRWARVARFYLKTFNLHLEYGARKARTGREAL